MKTYCPKNENVFKKKNIYKEDENDNNNYIIDNSNDNNDNENYNNNQNEDEKENKKLNINDLILRKKIKNMKEKLKILRILKRECKKIINK